MTKKTVWKVWLRRNLLTKEVENDFIAEVSTAGSTLHNDDIGARIVAGRSELRLETILSILQARDEIVREALAQGSAVQDGCVRIAPRVSGSWVGISHSFDPAIHKLTIEVTPSTEMRSTLETVGVEVLGEKDSGAFIGLITDITTGKTDGTITPDEDLVITGDKLKIIPEDEAGLGIFFVDATGVDHPVTHRLTENMPKKVICRVPPLTSGTYTLKIVTRFSTTYHVLNEPRIITYEFPLVVV
ncbi:MAG: DUF4469 domain-containing protein [Spirochaetaceae bacterium]|jgi:hypothetical protein|nr:DUF4469 domain-containing protein [Spirochaetaceae bacterium]